MDAMMSPYAVVSGWAIVDACVPDAQPSRHLVGWIQGHERLGSDEQPYIGSDLIRIDLSRSQVVTRRGRRILLTHNEHPDCDLHRGLTVMLRTAERVWRLPEGTMWRRVAMEPGGAWVLEPTATEVEAVLAEALRALGSPACADRWLETPAVELDGRAPRYVIHREDGRHRIHGLLTRMRESR